MSDLSRYEQETHIIFNAEETSAEICTADPTIKRKIDKLCLEHPDSYSVKYVNEEYKAYIVQNKKLCYPRKPRTGREYTEEERAALAERMRLLRKINNKLS